MAYIEAISKVSKGEILIEIDYNILGKYLHRSDYVWVTLNQLEEVKESIERNENIRLYLEDLVMVLSPSEIKSFKRITSLWRMTLVCLV